MSLFRFEPRERPLASTARFTGRVFASLIAALVIIGAALAAGMAGYHYTEGLGWLDAFLNASMLLGGMGPVDTLHTEAGKLFAGVYALACGLLFVLVSGVILAPVLHRVLHALHVPEDDR